MYLNRKEYNWKTVPSVSVGTWNHISLVVASKSWARGKPTLKRDRSLVSRLVGDSLHSSLHSFTYS